MNATDAPLNGNLELRVEINPATMDWVESPSRTVLRKRFHRVGPAEFGQVTSLVQYLPGATFPAHDHPRGEEILVLNGVFSDEHGDWPTGTFLLNPEGFRHAPFSRKGCLLWVKLRQFPGANRQHVALQTANEPWIDSVKRGVHWKKLYAQEPFTDSMRLESWDCPEEVGELRYPQGAEILVLKGGFSDARADHPPHSWLRIPVGGSLVPTSSHYCELYIKEGGFSYLESVPD